MPILLSEVQTPQGRTVARAEFVTEVTVQDARRFLEQTGIGTRYEKLPFLVVGNVSGVSSEVKKALANPHRLEKPMPVAVVLNSALARMVASLMLRGNDHSSAYFKNEADALAWLDEV